MNAVELINTEVAPIVERIFAEVNVSDFNKVNEIVHHEAEWVEYIREAFHNKNRSSIKKVSILVQSEKFRAEIEAMGEKCRENMGEEVFGEYQAKGIKTNKDLGESLVMNNLLGAIIQKVHNFAEIDFSIQATVVSNIKKEMDKMRDDITKLVKVATMEIIEETIGGRIDYFHLDLLDFLKTFSEKVGEEGTTESKVIDRAFDAVTDFDGSAEILARMVAESDVNPMEVLLNSDKVIAEAIHSQLHLALGVAYLWNKRGENEALTTEYMNERINEVINAITN